MAFMPGLRGPSRDRPDRLGSRASPLLRSSWHDAQKKTGHAIEQDRPDVLSQRHDWFDGQLDLDPERLVFIDETWTATNMRRECWSNVSPGWRAGS